MGFNPYTDAPTLTSADTAMVEENTSTDTVIYDAEANDADNDALSYSVSGTDQAYVTIDSDDGEIRLLNPADYETKDSYTFDVTASDGELSYTQTVTVNVTDINELPILTGQTINYSVTVASGTNSYGSGNKYYIDGVTSPTLDLIVGNTYEFDLLSVPGSHPFYLSSTEDGRWGGGGE